MDHFSPHTISSHDSEIFISRDIIKIKISVQRVVQQESAWHSHVMSLD